MIQSLINKYSKYIFACDFLRNGVSSQSESWFAAWQTQFAISFVEKEARCDRIIHGYHAIFKCIMHAGEG